MFNHQKYVILTALSLQEKSFFFPGAQPTGLPAASDDKVIEYNQYVLRSQALKSNGWIGKSVQTNCAQKKQQQNQQQQQKTTTIKKWCKVLILL